MIRLAEHLGMTLAEVGQIGSRELTIWREHYKRDPWDRRRTDFHLAQIASVMFNMWRGKDDQGRQVREFMLYPYPEREQPVEEQILLLKGSLKAKADNGQ